MKRTIYLSGKLAGRSKKEVLKERKEATELLVKAGFNVFDPVSLENNNKEKVFSTKCSLDQMRRFVVKEKLALTKCDAVLMLSGDILSEGSLLEFGFASYHCHIPVLLVSKLRKEKKLVGWSNVEAVRVVESVEEAIDYLKTKNIWDIVETYHSDYNSIQDWAGDITGDFNYDYTKSTKFSDPSENKNRIRKFFSNLAFWKSSQR